MGYDVTTLLGIHLKSAKDQSKVVEKLKSMKEVVEIYYTTGAYALIIKVHNKNIRSFHIFLSDKLQNISEIQATESFICLDQPVSRNLLVEEK
jgi:Lrp/AsnC family transcriptional regulator for asnA, asnC and gidA